VLATKSTGEFVVSWGEYQKKVVQPVNADNTLGSATEIAVQGHGGLQSLATVNGDGDFVLVYGDNTQQNMLFTTRVSAQLFDVDGNAVGSPVLVDSHQFASGTPQPAATDAKVVSLDKTTGLFGVSWSLENTDDETLSSVYWDTFTTNGAAIASTVNAAVEFKTKSEDRDYNLDPQAVALGSSGAAAMVWRGIDSVSGLWTLYVQRIEADHSLTAPVIKLNSSQFSSFEFRENIPSVQALASGKFVVSWINTDGDGDKSIFVQLFNADGTKSGAEVVLEGTQSSTQTDKQVSIAEIGSSGDFVVSWTGQNSFQYINSSIYVQRFNADGTVNGTTVQLDGTSSNTLDEMSNLVSLGADGDFAVAFGGDNGSNNDIYVQYFDANGNPLSYSETFSFGQILSSLELDSSAVLTVPISGIDDSGSVILTLNSQSYTGTISSGVASITIPSVDLIALPEGSNTYQIDATDSAGNTASTLSGSFEKAKSAEFNEIITGASTSYTDTGAAVDDSGANADGTPDIVIKLNDISENDELELVVDGVVISTHTVTGSDVTSGEVTFAGVDVATNDASSDRSVSLGLKVTHITETQQVDTWEFNW